MGVLRDLRRYAEDNNNTRTHSPRELAEFQRQWESHRRELFDLKLNEVLTGNENVEDLISLKLPYRYETLSHKEKKHYHEKMKQIDKSTNDIGFLKAILELQSDFSFIAEELRANYLDRLKWMKASQHQACIDRALYLIKGYQLKFYFDNFTSSVQKYLHDIINKKDSNKYQEKIAAMQEFTNLYSKILKDSCNADGLLQIDKFLAFIKTEIFQKLQRMHNFLDRARLYSLSIYEPGKFGRHEELEIERVSESCKSGISRRMDTPHCFEFREIMRQQLQYIPESQQRTLAIKLEKSLHEDVDSIPDFMLSKIGAVHYPRRMADLFQSTLIMSKEFYENFLECLTENLAVNIDIVDLYKMLNSHLAKYRNEQSDISKTSYAYPQYAKPGFTDHINARRFPLYEITSHGLMHEVLKLYAVSSFDNREYHLYVIEVLLREGFSVYYGMDENNLNALEFVEERVKDSKGISWDLYLLILKYTFARSPFGEKVRIELMDYCQTSLKNVESGAWTSWHSLETKSLRFKEVGSLIKTLADSSYHFDDKKLLEEIQETVVIMSCNLLDGSKLLVNLKKILAEVDAGLPYLGKYDNIPFPIIKTEIEMGSLKIFTSQALSLFNRYIVPTDPLMTDISHSHRI